MKIEEKFIENKPIKKTTYIAKDGERFDREEECWLHEKYISMTDEKRISHDTEDYWILFKTQVELDEFIKYRRSSECNIEKQNGKFPVWVKFEYLYDNNSLEEYVTTPLLKEDYKKICNLKKMIEDTQI